MKNQFFKLIALMLLLAILATALASCAKKDAYRVEMDVEGFGTIEMRLIRQSAPATVDNFIKLAKENFYDGLTFIRAQEGFVIQGGCPNKDGTGSSAATIPGEFSSNGFAKNRISHKAGVISMARSNDPDSASCQFFITIGDATESLDGKYAGFGYIEESSMPIVYAIAEAMFPYADFSMGFVKDVSKQPVITDVRVVGSYNIR